MDYKTLIEKALNGRAVNKAAKEWGVPQQTLDRYVKGKQLPDYQTALILAREAGVDAGEVMRICAAEEAQKKPRGMFMEYGLATVSSMVITVLLALAGFLAPIDNAQAATKAQGFEMVPFRQRIKHLATSNKPLLSGFFFSYAGFFAYHRDCFC